MCKILKEKYGKTHNLIFGCANTSWELQKSIEFGKNVDEFLKLNCVVLEGVTHHGVRKGNTHKVVSWDDVDMKQKAFTEMIKKYGIPNPSWLHCTRELKTNPMTSYLRSIGWEAGTYLTAIGYRADELDRVPEDYKERNLIFPLIDEGIKKEDVYRIFSKEWPFTLEIKEHEGNCQGCFKKNDRKLLTIIKENPERFEFPEKMEKEFGRIGPEFIKDNNAPMRKFYRKNRSVEDLRNESKMPFEDFKDELFDKHFGGCQESCEPFAD